MKNAAILLYTCCKVLQLVEFFKSWIEDHKLISKLIAEKFELLDPVDVC